MAGHPSGCVEISSKYWINKSHLDKIRRFSNACPNSKHRYLTLKLCVRTKERHSVKPPSDHEITVSNHLQSYSFEHPGKGMVRTVLGYFEVLGPNGRHRCLLYQPLGMSYTEFLKLHPKGMFSKELVQRSTQLLLLTLDYLHQCHVAHTGAFSLRKM